jgi:hypothetical protein
MNRKTESINESINFFDVPIPENIAHESALPRAQLHQLDWSRLTHLQPLVQQPDGQTLAEHLAAPIYRLLLKYLHCKVFGSNLSPRIVFFL